MKTSTFTLSCSIQAINFILVFVKPQKLFSLKIFLVYGTFQFCIVVYSLEMATALNQEVYEVLLEVRKKFRGGSIK